MTTISVVENKISAIKKYLNILDKYRKYTKEQIEQDLGIRGALERYLYLVVQSAIDLAEAVVAFKNFRKPTTTSESFRILNEEDVISTELAEKLVKMVGFRNVLAHDYEDIDYDIVYDVLHEKYKDIERLIEQVKKNLNLLAT